MPEASDPLDALLADLEAVDWRRVDGAVVGSAAEVEALLEVEA